MELALGLEGRGPLGPRVYAELRQAIVEGRLQPGDKLPSSRELAWRLKLARNTVSAAYERLAAEGYLGTRPGSGTFVSDHGEAPLPKGLGSDAALQPRFSPWALALSATHSIVPARDLPLDFRPGLPDLANFPVDVWRRLAARSLRRLSPRLALYGDPQGLSELRAEVARYLSRSRAVSGSTDDVLITSGSQQALDLVGRLLLAPGSAVAVEEPGYPMAKLVFGAIGARIVPVPVDEDGLVVDRLPEDAGMVYVTPSHQFPLGVALSLARRKRLLEWAIRRNAVIVEDDYDSEFRFGGRPLESLQGLDRSGSVVYLGTFSKVLFPGLRLGYVVAPRRMRERFVAAKWLTDRHTPALEQTIMAAFIAEGHFSRYLRRMQRIYGERQAALTAALRRFFGGVLEPLPSHAGLHVSAWLPRRFDADELIARAYEAGVGLYSIAPFYAGRARPGLMFGYGACGIEDIEEGVRRLRGIFDSMRAT
jgi:GntR family transcriptional regulator/MocR family aminotransferase